MGGAHNSAPTGSVTRGGMNKANSAGSSATATSTDYLETNGAMERNVSMSLATATLMFFGVLVWIL
jgi:hypothetical protein